MTGANDQACSSCGHTRYLHNGTRGLGCHGSTTVYADSVSGPPRPVTVPCRCTGFKAGGETMGPNPDPGTPVTGITADITDAEEVAFAAARALTELSTAVTFAHQAYGKAVADAHNAYITTMARLHRAPAATPPGPGTTA